jgi:predicted hydrocarbon binding protein
MKGIVFNLIEAIIEKEFGSIMWDRVLDEAGLKGAYTSLGNYSDYEFFSIVEAASAVMNLSVTDTLRWVGRRSMGQFKDLVPYIFENYNNSESFIKDINNIIHPEVKKLYPGAVCPHFHVRLSQKKSVSFIYNSPRKLCALAEGFMQSCAEVYEDRIKIRQPECVHEGSSQCVFVVEWVS